MPRAGPADRVEFVMRNLILPLTALFCLFSSVAWSLALLDLLK
jgi:hypothetical protein